MLEYGDREVRNNITKCETLLRSSRQIYILENIFTYHKTQLHGKNTFTRTKQIYILENKLTRRKHFYQSRNKFTMTDSSRKGNVPHTGSDAVKGVVVGERGNSCFGCGCGVNGVNKVYGDRTWTAAEGCFARFVANTWAA